MSWFRRDRSAGGSGTDADATTAEEAGPGRAAADVPAGTADVPAPAGGGRQGGPFDVDEAHGDTPRVDLGALRLPARVGMELRLEVEDATKRVIAATVGLQGSTLQLQAFAAPRTTGIWAEVREEITASVSGQGGTTEERDGPFGTELLARLPARTADGRTAHRAVRFVGVDGPRWFLRGVLSGAAAVQADPAAALEEVLRGTVVVRGSEAMPPRELLALTLPAQAQAQASPAAAAGQTEVQGGADGPGGADGEDGADGEGGPPPAADGPPEGAGEGGSPRPRLAPPERGPEITETR